MATPSFRYNGVTWFSSLQQGLFMFCVCQTSGRLRLRHWLQIKWWKSIQVLSTSTTPYQYSTAFIIFNKCRKKIQVPQQQSRRSQNRAVMVNTETWGRWGTDDGWGVPQWEGNTRTRTRWRVLYALTSDKSLCSFQSLNASRWAAEHHTWASFYSHTETSGLRKIGEQTNDLNLTALSSQWIQFHHPCVCSGINMLTPSVDRRVEHDGSLGEGKLHGGSESGFWSIQSSAFLQRRRQCWPKKLKQQRHPGKQGSQPTGGVGGHLKMERWGKYLNQQFVFKIRSCPCFCQCCSCRIQIYSEWDTFAFSYKLTSLLQPGLNLTHSHAVL